jgi:hypothetical protein
MIDDDDAFLIANILFEKMEDVISIDWNALDVNENDPYSTAILALAARLSKEIKEY